MKLKLLSLALLSSFATAQTTLDNQVKDYTKKIDNIVITEKTKMKAELQKVDDAFLSGQITKDEQISQKDAIAKRYEIQINDRIEQQRTQMDSITKSSVVASVFGINKVENQQINSSNSLLSLGINVKKKNSRPSINKNTLSVSYGFMNLAKDKGSFNPFETDSEMRIGNSHSVEIQYRKDRQLGSLSSPLFIRYGLAYRADTYMPKRPQIFVQNENQLSLENFQNGSLKRSKLRNVYLTLPVEFQLVLNPKYTEYEGGSYLDTRKKMWKLGIGAYAGINTRSIVKVKYYNPEGKFDKYQYTLDNGVEPFLFGGKLSLGYRGFNLFIKKDFTPIFNNKASIPNKNGIQIGIELMNIDF
ncbi:hypothetical protein [Chryseobacterium sp. T1]